LGIKDELAEGFNRRSSILELEVISRLGDDHTNLTRTFQNLAVHLGAPNMRRTVWRVGARNQGPLLQLPQRKPEREIWAVEVYKNLKGDEVDNIISYEKWINQ